VVLVFLFSFFFAVKLPPPPLRFHVPLFLSACPLLSPISHRLRVIANILAYSFLSLLPLYSQIKSPDATFLSSSTKLSLRSPRAFRAPRSPRAMPSVADLGGVFVLGAAPQPPWLSRWARARATRRWARALFLCVVYTTADGEDYHASCAPSVPITSGLAPRTAADLLDHDLPTDAASDCCASRFMYPPGLLLRNSVSGQSCFGGLLLKFLCSYVFFLFF
jgi:hypothetical protein